MFVLLISVPVLLIYVQALLISVPGLLISAQALLISVPVLPISVMATLGVCVSVSRVGSVSGVFRVLLGV